MVDDDAEFAHLKEDKMELDWESDQGEDSEEEPPEITADDLRKQLLHASKMNVSDFPAHALRQYLINALRRRLVSTHTTSLGRTPYFFAGSWRLSTLRSRPALSLL